MWLSQGMLWTWKSERALLRPRAFSMFCWETQKRRALGEEDGERRQGNISHGVAGIIAGAPIGKSGGDDAQAFDQVIKAARIHAPRNARTAPKVTSYNRVTNRDKHVNTGLMASASSSPVQPRTSLQFKMTIANINLPEIELLRAIGPCSQSFLPLLEGLGSLVRWSAL